MSTPKRRLRVFDDRRHRRSIFATTKPHYSRQTRAVDERCSPEVGRELVRSTCRSSSSRSTAKNRRRTAALNSPSHRWPSDRRIAAASRRGIQKRSRRRVCECASASRRLGRRADEQEAQTRAAAVQRRRRRRLHQLAVSPDRAAKPQRRLVLVERATAAAAAAANDKQHRDRWRAAAASSPAAAGRQAGQLSEVAARLGKRRNPSLAQKCSRDDSRRSQRSCLQRSPQYKLYDDDDDFAASASHATVAANRSPLSAASLPTAQQRKARGRPPKEQKFFALATPPLSAASSSKVQPASTPRRAHIADNSIESVPPKRVKSAGNTPASGGAQLAVEMTAPRSRKNREIDNLLNMDFGPGRTPFIVCISCNNKRHLSYRRICRAQILKNSPSAFSHLNSVSKITSAAVRIVNAGQVQRALELFDYLPPLAFVFFSTKLFQTTDAYRALR